MQVVIDLPEQDYELACKYPDVLFGSYGRAIAKGTPLSKGNKCKWIHYDYRTVCPREHDIDNPYWRIPEYRMDTLKYCPYCGKEIEIEADKESEDEEDGE